MDVLIAVLSPDLSEEVQKRKKNDFLISYLYDNFHKCCDKTLWGLAIEALTSVIVISQKCADLLICNYL